MALLWKALAVSFALLMLATALSAGPAAQGLAQKSSIASPQGGLAPTNRTTFVDDSLAVPDSLDPANGFYTQDGPVFSNIFQELVEFNGSSETQIVPVLASAVNAFNHNMNYTFQIRSGVTFSNGDPVNAYAAWFSLVRMLYMNAPTGTALANFGTLTYNYDYTPGDPQFPWGLLNAVQSVTGEPVTTNLPLAVTFMDNMLSHFDPSNITQARIMAYPGQAYVVTGLMGLQVNLLVHYDYFLDDLASWWGAIVDPASVDSTGGVQSNTVDAYFSNNGGVGTGPYEFASIGPAMAPIVLKANPAYWAQGYANSKKLPFLEKGTIATIVINDGVSLSDQIAQFDSNSAQLASVPPTSFNQLYGGYKYKATVPFSSLMLDFGQIPEVVTLSMNTNLAPTDNLDFRLAMEHAVNLTEILAQTLINNGTYYGRSFLGPSNPVFGSLYNPGNIPLYAYNVNLAAVELSQAGQTEGFYVTMANGTVLGDPYGTLLPPLTCDVNCFNTPFTIFEGELSVLGVQIQVVGGGPTNIGLYGWISDWGDPFYQLAEPLLDPVQGYDPAQVNIPTLNSIFAVAPYGSSLSDQVAYMTQIYSITAAFAPYIWLPTGDATFEVQPYAHGFIYNPFTDADYYNTVYYHPYVSQGASHPLAV